MLKTTLAEVVAFLGARQSIRLITDGAAAHRSTRLKVDEFLRVENSPPHSPEINQIERLFKKPRARLKNRVFETLPVVEEAKIEAVKLCFKDSPRVKKLTFDSWRHTSPN